MADSSENPEITTSQFDDLFDSDDDTKYVRSADGSYQPFQIDAETYKQQQKARHRENLMVLGLGLGGELGQWWVGMQALNDPAIEASRKEMARLQAKADAPVESMDEATKVAFRNAAMAPVIRTHERIQDQAKNIAASMGDNSARTFLKATEDLSIDAANQAVNIEAKIASIDLDQKAQQRLDKDRAREAAKSIRAMMFKLREERVREPIHKLIGNVAKHGAKVLASTPAPSYEAEMRDAIDAGADIEDIKKLKDLEGKLFARARMKKQIKGIIKEDLEKDPAYMAGLSSEDRKRLEAQRAIEDAEKATDLSRYATGFTEAEPLGDDEIDDLDDSNIENILNMDDSGMTEAQRREMVGLEGDVSDAEKRKLFAEKQTLLREALGRTFMYNKVEGKANKYRKGEYEYFFEPISDVWYVYKDGEKLDYELPIADAANSNVPGEIELFQLASRDGLIEQENIDILTANMRG